MIVNRAVLAVGLVAGVIPLTAMVLEGGGRESRMGAYNRLEFCGDLARPVGRLRRLAP